MFMNNAQTDLTSPAKNRKNKRAKLDDPSIAPPPCQCPGDSTDEAPLYCHLGYASSAPLLHSLLLSRFGLVDGQLRLVRIVWTGVEAKTRTGCPVTESVIQRRSLEEKVCVFYRDRRGHNCECSVIVVIICHWEGFEERRSSYVYSVLAGTLPTQGIATQRQCDKNPQKTCHCQGVEGAGGACYSFGCSWTMYFNGCKFARSKTVKKFRLDDKSPNFDAAMEGLIERTLQPLADDTAALYKKLAPHSFSNQIADQDSCIECKIGTGAERPFMGVTACLDFSAHNHRDKHNHSSGLTVVVTLLGRQTTLGTDPALDQIHSLPLYRLAPEETDYHATVYPGYYFDGGDDPTPRHHPCGGVGIIPTHGSVLLEHALRELHVTTPLPRPSRETPTRIAVVFYQHKNMRLRDHGFRETEEKLRRLKELKKEQERNALPSPPYHQGLPSLEEQITAAKLFLEQERLMLYQIPQLLPVIRHVDAQVTPTRDTVTVARSGGGLRVVGPYQHAVTPGRCETCCSRNTAASSTLPTGDAAAAGNTAPPQNEKPKKKKSKDKKKKKSTESSVTIPPIAASGQLVMNYPSYNY